MSIFNNVIFDEFTLLEGKQAEEYLKRKKEEADKEEDKYIKKYSMIKGDSNSGNRRVNKDGMDEKTRSYHPTAENDPKHRTAKEIENHRMQYGDIMPKKTKSEKALHDDRLKEVKSRNYATNALANKREIYWNSDDRKERIKGDNLACPDIYNYQAAHDAARRHYRHTHKNESAFDGIKMI